MTIIDGKQGDTYFGFWERAKAVLTVIGGLLTFAAFIFTALIVLVANS